MGFVRGDHPLFEQYKTIIGPQHLTPFEIMKWQAEKNHVEPPIPEEISVVSFILPMTKQTIESNAQRNENPSEEWGPNAVIGGDFLADNGKGNNLRING